ncbi:MAG: hypothetical protein H7Y22_11185 [Gemmatimonadaceae bacterium]|nr:hypothetical protein [Gloeobacterales cyanobacterium ES-bin-141]
MDSNHKWQHLIPWLTPQLVDTLAEKLTVEISGIGIIAGCGKARGGNDFELQIFTEGYVLNIPTAGEADN